MVATVLALTGLVGCGDDDTGHGTPGGEIGAYPGDRALEPEEVVRDYVDALNERDGGRFCALVAPYISGRIDIAARDPDSPLAALKGCPDLVHGFIGYIEDCCPPKFKRATIEEIHEGDSRGGLRRFDVNLTLDLENTTDRRRHRQPLRDVVWLARFGGAWRVARLGAVAHAASLGWDPVEAGDEKTLLTPPDVAREMSAYRAQLRTFRALLADRRASYVEPGEPADCSGALERADPADDRGDGARSRDARPDLRFLRIRSEDGRVCVAFETAAEIRGPLTFTFNLRKGASGDGFIQVFTAELRADGKVRVASGVDEDHHSLSVPAEVGLRGRLFTLVLDRKSFEEGEPAPLSEGDPPLDKFAFMASVSAPVSGGGSATDGFGSEGPWPYAYPGGWRCGLTDELCSKAHAGEVRPPGAPPAHPTISEHARRIKQELTRTCARFGGHIGKLPTSPAYPAADIACFVRYGKRDYQLPTNDDGRFAPSPPAAGRRLCWELDRGVRQTGRMIARSKGHPFRVKLSTYHPDTGICEQESRIVTIRP